MWKCEHLVQTCCCIGKILFIISTVCHQFDPSCMKWCISTAIKMIILMNIRKYRLLQLILFSPILIICCECSNIYIYDTRIPISLFCICVFYADFLSMYAKLKIFFVLCRVLLYQFQILTWIWWELREFLWFTKWLFKI